MLLHNVAATAVGLALSLEELVAQEDVAIALLAALHHLVALVATVLPHLLHQVSPQDKAQVNHPPAVPVQDVPLEKVLGMVHHQDVLVQVVHQVNPRGKAPVSHPPAVPVQDVHLVRQRNTVKMDVVTQNKLLPYQVAAQIPILLMVVNVADDFHFSL